MISDAPADGWAERLAEGTFVVGRLATDLRFRAGWNSALWEIHKMVADGIVITTELLSDMASQ